MTTDEQLDGVLAPDSKVARDFNVHPKTLQRWDNRPELGFPPAIWINGRKYRNLSALRAWEQAMARKVAASPQLRKAKATA